MKTIPLIFVILVIILLTIITLRKEDNKTIKPRKIFITKIEPRDDTSCIYYTNFPVNIIDHYNAFKIGDTLRLIKR